MVIDRRLPCRRRLPPTAKVCVQQPQSTLLVCALDGRIDNGATARTGPVRYYATASSIRQAARQIPDLSRIIRVRSSLTDGSRLRGALSIADIGAQTSPPAPGAPLAAFGSLVPSCWQTLLFNHRTGIFNSAASSIGRELKVDRTARFMRNKFANNARPLARFAWSFDDGSTAFLLHAARATSAHATIRLCSPRWQKDIPTGARINKCRLVLCSTTLNTRVVYNDAPNCRADAVEKRRAAR